MVDGMDVGPIIVSRPRAHEAIKLVETGDGLQGEDRESGIATILVLNRLSFEAAEGDH